MRESIDIGTGFYDDLPYASGVKVSGTLLYSAGMTARDDDGNAVGVDDMAAQFAQIFKRLEQVAEKGGTSLHHLVKLTIYVTDVDRAYADPNQWRRYFTGRPACTLVGVAQLKSPEIMVEIDAIFSVPDGGDS